jgi:hypothetical protein
MRRTGGGGCIAAIENELFIKEIARLGTTARYLTSVCSGSLILAAAGFLDIGLRPHVPKGKVDARRHGNRSLRYLMKPEALSLANHHEPVPRFQFKRDCFLCLPVTELKPPCSPERQAGNRRTARLRDVRPGAWLISPYSGWKWAKWSGGDVGWLRQTLSCPRSCKCRHAMTFRKCAITATDALWFGRGRFRPNLSPRRAFSDDHERYPIRRISVAWVGGIADVGEHGTAQRLGMAPSAMGVCRLLALAAAR